MSKSPASWTGAEGQLLLVIGGGEYGSRALEFGREMNARTVIIDQNPRSQAARVATHVISPEEVSSIDVGEAGFIEGEVGAVLDLLKQETPYYVFTAIPIHLGSQLARRRAELMGRQFKPWEEGLREALTGLPPRIVRMIGDGSIIASYMPSDLQCQDDCLSPYRCPVTGKVKPAPLYALFQYAVSDLPYAIVLVKDQLRPGLGAIRGGSLQELLGLVDERPSSLVVATACRCHGVLHAFH